MAPVSHKRRSIAEGSSRTDFKKRERGGEGERVLDKPMSDQLEEAERELYKHVGCKMFHSAGDAAHMLR